MARTKITAPTTDVISDSGGVLWSIVRGEQLEYPVVLNFITDASSGFTYEAVVVEAQNTGNGDIPTTIMPAGRQNTLVTRTATPRGNWAAATTYQREDYVFVPATSKYYKLLEKTNYVSAVSPQLDPNWVEYDIRTVYVQFPSTLAANWTIAPTAEYPVYGFFELQVMEPVAAFYRRTWKPIRGLVQMMFSPTDLVP
jgi:hypothetical protein